MSIVEEKQNYIRTVIEQWQLTDEERFILTGDFSDAAAIEQRCDSIYNVKLDLARVYGGDDPAAEAHWLRCPIKPLNDRSPLQYAKDKGVEALSSFLRGP